MRFKELISEEVAPAQVDWDKFNAALAASAIQRNVPRGIDGIVYLGIIGDPSSNTNLEVRFKRDVRIGLDMSPDRSDAYVMQGAIAQYHYTDSTFKGRNIAGANGLQVGTDFDILISWNDRPAEDWPKIGENLNLTIAHELMHRGFAIADRIPGIKSLMSEETVNYLEHRISRIIPGVLNPADLLKPGAFSPFGKVNEHLASLEHMMIYAMLTGTGKLMPSGPADSTAQPNTWIDDVKKFRKIYLDIEAAARQYVLSYPAPKGSLLALRNELSGETPGYAPTVVADANGKPTLKLIPDEKQTASTKINGSGTTTAWAPKPVATGGAAGDPVKGVVKKPSPPIKLKGWTLSDS
jgi:hypothetical protein